MEDHVRSHGERFMYRKSVGLGVVVLSEKGLADYRDTELGRAGFVGWLERAGADIGGGLTRATNVVEIRKCACKEKDTAQGLEAR